ncbi:EthD domain-containing protein [Chloroflexota bacterium]
MIKAITLVKRKPGMSMEEFVKHYEEVHAPLGMRIFPKMKRYVRNHVLVPPGAEEPAFDCITEGWWESMDDVIAAMRFVRSNEGKVIRDDEEKFMDRGKMVSCIVEEKRSR